MKVFERSSFFISSAFVNSQDIHKRLFIFQQDLFVALEVSYINGQPIEANKMEKYRICKGVCNTPFYILFGEEFP